MDNNQSPAASLIELARGMEKLAEAIEAEPKAENTASTPLPDYGKLGTVTSAGTDPLTGFLLS